MEYFSEIFLADGTSKVLGVMHPSISEAQNECARFLKKNGLVRKPFTNRSTDPVQYVQIKKLYKSGRCGVHASYRFIDWYNTCDGAGHLVVQGGYFRKIK
tara:strand:+ start:860 stop:1159 length:300 start_codon:yes stop_codon:yes gene_type:complete